MRGEAPWEAHGASGGGWRIAQQGVKRANSANARLDALKPATIVGSAAVDTGTDPNNPGPTGVNNFGSDLPAGPAVPLGGPSAADGEYARAVANVLFVTPTRTISVDAVSFADGAADRCSFNGVAVAS
jgi:hypothetical protein